MPNEETDAGDGLRLNRRSALAAIGAGAGTVVGVGAFSGTAVAWKRFGVCFRGCEDGNEVRMLVAESDIDHGGSDDPPAVAHVVVAADGEAVCRPVEFTAENATTDPERFGDTSVVTYTAGSDERVLGVLEYNYSPDPAKRFDDPAWCVHVNEGAITDETPAVHSAPCVPRDHSVCPTDDICGDPCEAGDDEDGKDDEDDGVVVEFEDCKTAHVRGRKHDLEGILVHYLLDTETAARPVHLSVPVGTDLPVPIDDRQITRDFTDYVIAFVEHRGADGTESAYPPGEVDCDTDLSGRESVQVDLDLADRTVTLGADDSIDSVTMDGTVAFSYANWDDDTGGVDHAFVSTWATADAPIDFPDRDVERFYDVHQDTDVVCKDLAITFDVPPEVGNPDPGEAIETEIESHAFVGLERDPDADRMQNIGDWRVHDESVLRIERDTTGS